MTNHCFHIVKGAKKSLLYRWAFIIPLFLATYTVSAQNTDTPPADHSSTMIEVKATVIGNIDLTTIRNMRFGKVSPGQQTVSISPTRESEAGKMVASGIPNSEIRIRYISERQLTHSGGGEPLTFFYDVAGSQTDNQETSELLETENRNLQFNSDGKFFLWIGGRANITNVEPGNYEGEFTIEIEYI